MDDDALPPGWEVWNVEPTTEIYAYRTDVFDGGAFPSPCLPTIHLARGKRSRRPGRQRVGDDWHVTLYLEPDVSDGGATYESKEAALAAGRELARDFAAGEVDYRDCYQVPREAYLDRLDELVGPSTPDD